MNEFKIIPQAPDYKINKECEVRRVINDKPLLILDDRKVLLKNKDGALQRFSVEDLVKELFSTTTTKELEEIEQNDTHESEDADLVKQESVSPESSEQKSTEHIESEIPKKRKKYIWTFIGKTGSGKPPKIEDVKIKRGRGRPAGSKNKKK